MAVLIGGLDFWDKDFCTMAAKRLLLFYLCGLERIPARLNM